VDVFLSEIPFPAIMRHTHKTKSKQKPAHDWKTCMSTWHIYLPAPRISSILLD